MSGTETEGDETEWTKANLERLLTSMKESIRRRDRMAPFTEGMKTLDWNNVAFSYFSPDECREKWQDMMKKMRTVRTLEELLSEAEDELSNGNKTMRVENLREESPLLPKRPAPPEEIFYKENVGRFQEQHPDLSNKELFNLVLDKYKELPDEEKVQYLEIFQQANVEYKKEMRRIEEDQSSSSVSNRKKKKRGTLTGNGNDETSRDLCLPPKPPRSGYWLFINEMRSRNNGGLIKTCSDEWRMLTSQQKVEYTERWQELKRRYNEELNKCLATLDETERQRVLAECCGTKPRKMPVKKRKDDGAKAQLEPKMPPRSGNAVFVQKKMEELRTGLPDSKERFLKVSRLWKDLSKEQRERYTEEAKKSVITYSDKLQKWFKTLKPAEQEGYLAYKPGKHKYLSARLLKRGKAPSDSEDEDMEDSSDEENLSIDEEETEDDEEEASDVTFDMY